MDDDIEINAADDEPESRRYGYDYESNCIVCGQSPTVYVIENDCIVHDTELCGVCCFGSASALSDLEI